MARIVSAALGIVPTLQTTRLGRAISDTEVERHLQQICDEAHARWPVLDVLIVHRYGDILPGEPIVLVAAWAAHRGPAFEACRHLIESLKSRAPFWKRETLDAGQPRWVARNTPA